MIADRSNPVRTVSRTKWATCPEGTKSWIDGGSSQTWSTSQARNVLLIPRLNHDAPSSSRKIRLLGQAPSIVVSKSGGGDGCPKFNWSRYRVNNKLRRNSPLDFWFCSVWIHILSP